jgi:hypothetical protein
MRLIDPDNTKKVSQWSPISKAWKAATDCENDQYLDTSLSAVDPLQWKCAACPPHGSCRGAVLVGDIVPQHGAWQCAGASNATDTDDGVVPRFQQCIDVSACVGGKEGFGCNISNGHASSADIPYAANPLCTVCAPGFMPSTSVPGTCIECEEGRQFFFLITAALCLIIILVVMLTLKMRSSGGAKAIHSGLKRTMLGHIQMVGMLMALDVSWPPALRSFLVFFDSLSTAGTGGATGLLCNSRRGPSEIVYALCIILVLAPPLFWALSYAYWIHLVPIMGWTCHGTLRDDGDDGTSGKTKVAHDHRPPAIVAVGTTIHARDLGVGKTRKTDDDFSDAKTNSVPDLHTGNKRKADDKRRRRRRWTPTDALYATNVLMCYIIVPAIMRVAFRLMRCTDVCGTNRLHLDMKVECFASGHAVMTFSVIVPAILIYACLLPIGALIYIRAKRAALQTLGTAAESKSFMFRFGLLYSGYSDAHWYWESVNFARKFFTILLVSLGGGAAGLRCHLALGLIMFCLHLQHQYRPFYDLAAHPNSAAERIHPDQRILHRFEILSLCILSVTIFSSALYTKNLRELYTGFGDFLGFVVILANLVFVAVNAYVMCVYFGRNSTVGKLVKHASSRIQLQWIKVVTRPVAGGESSPREEGGSDIDAETLVELREIEMHANPMRALRR